jgi:hypothetical protein
MINVNKEAEEYSEFGKTTSKWQPIVQKTFIAGHNSKATQAKIIQAQIDENTSILEMLKMHGNDRCIYVIRERIINLEQQLKQLENE